MQQCNCHKCKACQNKSMTIGACRKIGRPPATTHRRPSPTTTGVSDPRGDRRARRARRSPKQGGGNSSGRRSSPKERGGEEVPKAPTRGAKPPCPKGSEPKARPSPKETELEELSERSSAVPKGHFAKQNHNKIENGALKRVKRVWRSQIYKMEQNIKLLNGRRVLSKSKMKLGF